MAAQLDHRIALQRQFERADDRRAALLVDHGQHVGYPPPPRIGAAESGQFFRPRIEELDQPVRVGDHDGVADGFDRHPQALLFDQQLVVLALQRGDQPSDVLGHVVERQLGFAHLGRRAMRHVGARSEIAALDCPRRRAQGVQAAQVDLQEPAQQQHGARQAADGQHGEANCQRPQALQGRAGIQRNRHRTVGRPAHDQFGLRMRRANIQQCGEPGRVALRSRRRARLERKLAEREAHRQNPRAGGTRRDRLFDRGVVAQQGLILDRRHDRAQLALGADVEALLRTLCERQTERRQRRQIHQQHQRKHRAQNADMQAVARAAHSRPITHSRIPGCA